jgi:hypothetical protein
LYGGGPEDRRRRSDILDVPVQRIKVVDAGTGCGGLGLSGGELEADADDADTDEIEPTLADTAVVPGWASVGTDDWLLNIGSSSTVEQLATCSTCMPIRPTKSTATDASMVFSLGTALDMHPRTTTTGYTVCWNSGAPGALYVRVGALTLLGPEMIGDQDIDTLTQLEMHDDKRWYCTLGIPGCTIKLPSVGVQPDAVLKIVDEEDYADCNGCYTIGQRYYTWEIGTYNNVPTPNACQQLCLTYVKESTGDHCEKWTWTDN